MTHVSIMVPDSSVLLSSVVGLFKIFDLANHHSAEGGRGAAFELHLVGGASTADLYGGRLVVKPDLTLAEVAATDLAIIPAMAGNIAEAMKNNSVFIPWIREQYRAGCEIAGLCTGASFIVDTGLIHEKDCSWHWFVDATFRKQYPQINSLAEKTAAAPERIHSEGGAWFFLQKLLEHAVGEKTALACSASFQEPFNRGCQSVVCVSDPRRQHANRIAKKKRASVDGDPMQQMTVERFLSRFEVNHEDREGNLTIATLFENSLRKPVGHTNPKASCALREHEEQGRTDNHNTRTWKALFKKIERPERSYGNG
jgi:transcriptional regulator GlxA family with amidase domain